VNIGQTPYSRIFFNNPIQKEYDKQDELIGMPYSDGMPYQTEFLLINT